MMFELFPEGHHTSTRSMRLRPFKHLPKVLTLAAAEQADQEGDDDYSTNHCQRDYQRLEVH